MSIGNNPLVSIIVPARNEETCLGACLESLVSQTGITFEIIVVDDDSTDRTAEIARFSPKVHVIPASPLPDNWTGKNNAMSAGAKIARGKWLLFTDADTVHQPGSLARVVAEAEQHGAALLSYSPQQEVHGFWEKAVMPVIFAELAATYPPQAVNDPTSPIAAANGQYLMISREAYDAVGGHAAVAGDLLEDVAMARLVKRSGRKIFFRYAPDAVRTRMYRSFAQLREGWTKNLALLFAPVSNIVCFRLAEFLLIAVNAGASASLLLLRSQNAGFSRLPLGAALTPGVLALGTYAIFWLRIRKAHFSMFSNVLAVFGLPIFSYLLFTSGRLQIRGEIPWKNRKYDCANPKKLVPKWFTTGGGAFLISTLALCLLFVTMVFMVAYDGYTTHHR
jgi:glycosyltransferase involved in cell wall biosynthesis